MTDIENEGAADGPLREVPTIEAAKAVSHPLRVQILQTLDGEPRSPQSLAQELEQPLGSVSYHVIVLRDLGAIELTGIRQVRGALEHFYKARWRVRVEVDRID
jgi:DNA-binding transcriptional ArsR family regulator